MNAHLYQKIVATPILALHLVIILLLWFMLIRKDQAITAHFKKYGMVYGLIVSMAAVIGSLGFSEGFDYIPCKLCWAQRIFHYPQVILFSLALYYKDSNVWKYSLWLSIIGFLFAGYQVLIQFFPELAGSAVCGIVPAAGNCSDVLIQVYGYISIPVMSFTLFICLIMLSIYNYRKN